MPLDPRLVKALFNAALDLPGPAARPAFLDRECGDDTELRQRLQQLLDAYDRPASALERPLAVERAQAASDADKPATPERIPTPADGPASGSDAIPAGPSSGETPSLIGKVVAGRYKLRQEIGEGGMGSVYLAEQTEPVKRPVALKLIKPGMDSKTVLTRFESERQALALMDHPNIAKVLDAGATETGRPFFVMELVRGIPLTEYCDRHRLGLQERLALFRQICSAVQHAHVKGIIHRDLKPSNILVESHDGRPLPKVIDFGLAKAFGGAQLCEHSLYSAFGMVAGTPLYMAPEQACLSALDVDTRADIYALGVILYELLTGSTPIQRDTIKRAAFDEILRVIREVEPPTPSSRISTSEALPSLAATRQTEAARLSRFVRGDLDRIVMKALAKERQGRYESASALAQDIERFTNNEPVSARPPTPAYRLRKFVRRNRGRVITGSLVLLAGVIGLTAIGVLNERANHALRVANHATIRALFETREAQHAAQSALAQSEESRKQAQAVSAFLVEAFRSADPAQAGQNVTVRHVLDRASARLGQEFGGSPITKGALFDALGQTYLSLGMYGQAVSLHEQARRERAAALGPDHPDTLKSTSNLAGAYLVSGRFDRALPLLEQTLAKLKAKLGPDDSETLGCQTKLAEGYRAAGKLEQALPLLEHALKLTQSKLGPDHRDTLQRMYDLAQAYQAAGRFAEAIALYERTLFLRERALGPDHPETLRTRTSTGDAYQTVGRFAEATALYESTLRLQQERLGPDHPETLKSRAHLASAYLAADRVPEAIALQEATLKVQEAELGPEHPMTLESRKNLARAYAAAGRLAEARELFSATLRVCEARLGPDHPITLECRTGLAAVLASPGQPSASGTIAKPKSAQQPKEKAAQAPGAPAAKTEAIKK
jgi:serine/threonine protein kinase